MLYEVITGVAEAVDPGLFEADCERALFAALENVRGQVERAVAAEDYPAALRAIAALRAPVDAFFEGVMVMAKDEAVRVNRLALLTAVSRLFAGIADFSRIAD